MECPRSLQGDTLDRAMHRGSSPGNSILHYEPLTCTNWRRFCNITCSGVNRHANFSKQLFQMQRRQRLPSRTSTSWYTWGHGRAGQIQHQVPTRQFTGHAHTWRSKPTLTPATIVDFSIVTISSLRLWEKWMERELLKVSFHSLQQDTWLQVSLKQCGKSYVSMFSKLS